MPDVERQYQDTPVDQQVVYMETHNEEMIPSVSESSEGEGLLEEDHVEREVPLEEAPSFQFEHEVPLKEGGSAEGGTCPHVLEPIASTRRKTVRGQNYMLLFDERVSRLKLPLGVVKSDLGDVKTQLQMIIKLL